MGLTIINETVTSLCKTKHGFSDKEKEFVVQFAFRSGDKSLTNQLLMNWLPVRMSRNPKR